jgi:hypothetical protein
METDAACTEAQGSCADKSCTPSATKSIGFLSVVNGDDVYIVHDAPDGLIKQVHAMDLQQRDYHVQLHATHKFKYNSKEHLDYISSVADLNE